MDLNQAILYAQLVNAAYAISPQNTTNAAGQTVSVGEVDYQVVTSIFANDLSTDMNPISRAKPRLHRPGTPGGGRWRRCHRDPGH